MKIPSVYLIGGVAVGAALLWAWSKGARGTGEALASAAVDMVDGAVSQTVYTVSDGLGIPRTDPSKCAQAKAAGRTLDASFYCPAGEFLSYLWS